MQQEQQQQGRCGVGGGEPHVVGGRSELKEVTPEIQQIAESVKSDIENQLNKTLVAYVVLAYRSQPVAGTNHFFKIRCGPDEYIHVEVYETLPYSGSKRSVSSIEGGKSLDDTL
ncbi:cystatin-A-like [Rhinoraja longicauda]